MHSPQSDHSSQSKGFCAPRIRHPERIHEDARSKIPALAGKDLNLRIAKKLKCVHNLSLTSHQSPRPPPKHTHPHPPASHPATHAENPAPPAQSPPQSSSLSLPPHPDQFPSRESPLQSRAPQSHAHPHAADAGHTRDPHAA